MTSCLFSYGTLRLPSVQRARFNRLVEGVPDRLEGWRTEKVEIVDSEVVRVSGQRFHDILRHTGNAMDCVDGVRLELMDEELAAADAYEVDAYRRVRVRLASGLEAFVYVAREGSSVDE